MEDINWIENSERDKRLKKVRKDSSNKRCFDCSAKDPQWISYSFAIFVCLKCSGTHRSYGPHISFVRSCTLDRWQLKEIVAMEVGGNSRARQYLKKINKKKFDYTDEQARKYKDELEARIENVLKKRDEDDFSDQETNISEVPTTKESETTEFGGAPKPAPKEEMEESKPKKISKKNLKTKKFKVSFQPKFKKGGKKSKKLAAKKLDMDLDFNKMSLVDVVDKNSKPENEKKEDPLKDLKEEVDFEGTSSKKSTFKKTTFGGAGNNDKKSSEINTDYKGKTAFGSDQMFGGSGSGDNDNDEGSAGKSGSKFEDAKYLMMNKASSWYDSLKNKWGQKQ